MRRCGVILLASGLWACSSSPDFCTRFAPVVTKQENAISACTTSDGGGATADDALKIVGAEFPFSVAACETAIAACNSNDQTDLDHELTCIQQLPAFDCSGVIGGAEDAGLEDFSNSVEVCKPQLSAACQNMTMGQQGCGAETHTNITTQNAALQLGFQTPITDCLGVGDTHYFEVTVPSTTSPTQKAGGFFEFVFSNITVDVDGLLDVTLADSSGNPLQMASYAFDSPSTIFLSAAYGTSFLVEISGDSTLPLGYTLSASFNPINDPYKPDSQRSIAQPIMVGVPTSGSYLWAGQRNSNILITTTETSDFSDWFSVDFTSGGTTTVTLTTFPIDFAPAVDFVDGSGNIIRPSSGNSTSNTFGASLSYTVIAASAGPYYLHVYPFEVDNTSYSPYSFTSLQMSAVLPNNYTQPYTLTVSNPM